MDSTFCRIRPLGGSGARTSRVLRSGLVASITRQEVERIAALARLALSEDELERASAELGSILQYVETLERVDTTGVPPTAHVIPLVTPLRDDVAARPLEPALAVANAPESSGSAFVVPKVIEGEEQG